MKMNLKNKILDYIAKYNFWYAAKFIKVQRDYTFKLDMSDTSSFSIELLTKYAGTIVSYKDLTMGDNGLLNYELTIVHNPNNHKVDSKRFLKYTSRILMNMISESIKSAEKNSDEDRENNLSELDQERAVHAEIPAISEDRVPKRKRRKSAVRRNSKVHKQVQQSSDESVSESKPEGKQKP